MMRKKKNLPYFKKVFVDIAHVPSYDNFWDEEPGGEKKKETGFLHLRETLLSALCQVGMKVCEDAVP